MEPLLLICFVGMAMYLMMQSPEKREDVIRSRCPVCLTARGEKHADGCQWNEKR